ncbi:MAG: AraC family transcriptional regulator [Planctomycetota bacterium]
MGQTRGPDGAARNADRRHHVWDRFPQLARIGVAVEHFPRLGPGPVQWHGHDFLELNLVVAGACVHCIGDERFDAGPGVLGVVRFDAEHRLEPLGDGAEVYNVYLDPDRLALPDLPAALAGEIAALLPLDAGLAHSRNRLTHIGFPDPAAPAGVLAAMVREAAAGGPGSDAALLALFTAFLIQCGRRVRDEGVRTLPPGAGWDDMEAIRRRLDATWREAHRLDDLAARAGLSRSHLCRRFRAYTGMSVVTYLHQRRIEHAVARLRTGDEKVLAVALACGYRDLAFFNRKFREITGRTPRQLRATG